MREIRIGNRILSENSPPFIIAEAGVNYYEIAKQRGIEPIDAAKLMIEEASKAGADAIKFQTYKAEKLASKYSPAYWDTMKEPIKTQYHLFKKYDRFGEEEYIELAKYARKKNIIFLSTPFDEEAADFLENIVPVFKISSSDITNIPFIKYIAKKQKPIFLSTGASTIEEIREAVGAIESEGNYDIVLLHCILSYPTAYRNANLLMIRDIQKNFPNYLVGYSDHTLPDECMIVLFTAIMLGAKVIEKHFTLDKSLKGNDHYHSMDPIDLARLVKNVKLLNEVLGQEKKKPVECEMDAIKYARRSIVACQNIPKNAVIRREMVCFKRPGTGISPKFVDLVIGRKVKRDIMKDETIQWGDIE